MESENSSKSVNKSRGGLSAKYFLNASELGFSNAATSDDIIINRFNQTFEGIATYRVEMPTGILLLQAPETDQDSGAVFFYDRLHRDFYDLRFEGNDGDIRAEEFPELISEYGLLDLAEKPESDCIAHLLSKGVQSDVSSKVHLAKILARSQQLRPRLDDFD